MSNTYKVQPFNIRNGNKAPYFLIDSVNKNQANLDAKKEFKNKSALAAYPNWDIEVDKI